MLYHFTEMTVRTEQQPNGEFTAVDYVDYDLARRSPTGRGSTVLEAIADLADKLRELGELED